ncbi:ASCH domain-containing protein [Pseudomonas cremoricolorata]|uniref:ASCH domain-containing protein n=1 Tax=Pseudomonas cremoricolorata TaxID=157783 RepID=UPI000B06798A|nr:ASCH domain-containing protein [Pseudomonas cremoricolorata]
MPRPYKEFTIKALSIVHPSGTRIANGEKTLEIRRWAPDLQPDEDLLIVENRRFLNVEGDEDADGRAVAIVRVKAVRPFRVQDIPAACASYHEPGWLAWELSDVRPVCCAEPVLAARGLYDVQVTPLLLPKQACALAQDD